VEFAVEYKNPLTVEKRHVIFNRNTLISKSASGMSDKQSSGAEMRDVILPDGRDIPVDLPLIVLKPGTTPAVSLIF
jgi:hypothetical protein